MNQLTKASIEKWDKKVQNDPKYGKEQSLICDIIKRIPQNKDILDIAMKVSVIDLTNSTQLSHYKSKISLFDIANIILNTENFDKRVSSGDVSLVTEIARMCKDFGGKDKGVNLLSFASKYCCYHNVYQYNSDDYSIFDNVVSENLHLYSTKKLPLAKTTPEQWRKNIEYDKFNEYIGLLLDEYGIDSKIEGRRRMFDHFLWFTNR